MGSTRRLPSLVAALALAAAAFVILVTPELLAAPNGLAAPSALVVAVGCGAAILGGRAGRLTGLAVSWAGLALCALWLWLASDGFGMGSPWMDDMVEAAVLVVCFVAATLLLALSEGSLTGPRLALWLLGASATVVVALALVVPVLPVVGPAPVPMPIAS